MTTLFFLAAQAVAATPPPGAQWKVRQIDGGEMRYIQPVPRITDYPLAALRAGLQGTSVVQIVVSPAGTILSCETVQSSGSPELDARACEMYRRRARFEFTGIVKPVQLRAPVTWRVEDYVSPSAPQPGQAHGSPSPE